MTKVKKTEYLNARIETLRKTTQGLARIGALDKKTMRAFEPFCLTKVEVMSGEEIQALREREGVSQAVLARHLNVGAKRPSGPSLKLLAIVKAKGLDVIA